MIESSKRKPVDEEILEELAGGYLSPTALRERCMRKGISRATYFRHKRKLIKELKIEEIEVVQPDGKRIKKFMGSYNLADRRDIELYLKEMESSVKEIRERGIRDFGELCVGKRVAWYFSPNTSPRFQTKNEVSKFFKQHLIGEHDEKREGLLIALISMIDLEGSSSLWRRNLIECCKESVEKLAWHEPNARIRDLSISLLNRVVDEPLLELALDVIKNSNDEDFKVFLGTLGYILLSSPLARKNKYRIRSKLDEISAQNEMLRKRVEAILKHRYL